MTKRQLTSSLVDRQNILNNDYALTELQSEIRIKTIEFEGRPIIFKEQLARFFGITSRTVDNYIEKNHGELNQNGYVVVKGKSLKNLKNLLSGSDVNEKVFVNIKSPKIGIFDFRAFLNFAMLIDNNPTAKLLRQTILDIVIDTISARTGGNTKFINQRDEDFIGSWYQESNYRKEFTSALSRFVDMGNFKYPNYTNKIYVAIFKENANEYRKILNLQKNEKTRDTFYSEILDLISAFEHGFAEELKKEFGKIGKKLSNQQTDKLFNTFASNPIFTPLIDKARQKMSSRDLVFRDAFHQQLENYITPLQKEDFTKFIGEKSKELSDRLDDAKDVLERLKDR